MPGIRLLCTSSIDIREPLTISIDKEVDQILAESCSFPRGPNALENLDASTQVPTGFRHRAAGRITLPKKVQLPSSHVKARKRSADNERRRERRRRKAEAAKVQKTKYTTYLPRAIKYTSSQFGNPHSISVDFNAANFDSTKPGFIAKSYTGQQNQYFGKVLTLDELLGLGFSMVPWDGR